MIRLTSLLYTFDPTAPFSPFWPSIPACPWKHEEQKYVKILKLSPEYLTLNLKMGQNNISLIFTLWPLRPGGPGIPGNPLAPWNMKLVSMI